MDRAERVALALEHDRFARAVGTKYWLVYRHAARVERDDLIAAARLGLWQAALRYERGRGEFETFAWWYVTRAVRDQLRNDLARGIRVPSRKGDENRLKLLPVAAINDVDPVAPLESDSPDPGLWERLRKYMSPEQYDALILRYRDGRTFREAGRSLGVSGVTAFHRVRDGIATLAAHREDLE